MDALRPVLAGFLAVVALAGATAADEKAGAKPAVDVVAVARSFADGGGYNEKWTGSGTPAAITFGQARILAKGTGGTYCCGFTFTVVMRAAGEAGLLEGKTVEQVKQFQKEWYGAVREKEVAEKQCAAALERLGIGKQVTADAARPGDFLQFWRVKGGHSVVFLNWVERDGKRVGLNYRSSQGSTGGVGDKVEYFHGSGVEKGEVDPRRMYFARLGAG